METTIEREMDRARMRARMLARGRRPRVGAMCRLASLVEVRADVFCFGTWVGRDWGGDPDLICGTTACALGWATTMPELRRAGLRMVARSAGRHHAALIECVESDPDRPYAGTWHGGPHPQFTEAGAAALGISQELATWLFLTGDDVSPFLPASLPLARRIQPASNASAGHIARWIRDHSAALRAVLDDGEAIEDEEIGADDAGAGARAGGAP